MNFDEFKERKDEIKDQLSDDGNGEDIFDFDAVVDIAIDGTVSVSEKAVDTEDNSDSVEATIESEAADSIAEAENETVAVSDSENTSESEKEAVVASESVTEEKEVHTTANTEVESEIAENETSENSEADSSSTSESAKPDKAKEFEDKINRGYDTVKNLFAGFANKVSQKADDIQAKEKVGKLAETVSEKFASVVKNVENKFTKDNDAEKSDAGSSETSASTEINNTVDYSACESCGNDSCEECVANTAEQADDVCEANENSSEEIEKVEGIVVGSAEDKLDVIMQKVSSTARTGASLVKDAAKAVAPVVKDAAKNIGPKAKEAVDTVVPKVKETAKNLAPKVKETAQNIGPKVKETAKNIGPKFSEAMKKMGPKVKETAENVAPKVKQTAHDVADGISFQGYRIKANVKKKIRTKIKEAVFGKKDDNGENIRVKRVKKYSSNFMNHTMTVINHRHAVIKHCCKAGIPLQGLTHDLSKFSPAEFKYGVKYFRGNMSPNEGEREAYGYSNAWMHHKGRNKHHFEYWTDYNIEANKVMPVKMPLKYVIEMFCDRVAAGKIYKKDAYTNSSPYEYFDKGRARRTLHQETSDFLEKLLKMLAKKGEDYTFNYIKWYMKHHKDY